MWYILGNKKYFVVKVILICIVIIVVKLSWASLVAQMVKNLPAMREMQVGFLDWEDLLEKGMATHSSILTWEIPRTEEPGRLQSMVSPSQTWLSNWTTTTNELHRIQKGKRTLTVLLQEHTACFFEHRHTCSVTQSCLTLYDFMDGSWPGSSVHGILQARM